MPMVLNCVSAYFECVEVLIIVLLVRVLALKFLVAGVVVFDFFSHGFSQFFGLEVMPQ